MKYFYYFIDRIIFLFEYSDFVIIVGVSVFFINNGGGLVKVGISDSWNMWFEVCLVE